MNNKLICLAKRDNNNKRPYLLINPLQGKHMPVSPNEVMEHFSSFAETIKIENPLIIGFAETATAIGAAIATTMTADVFYMHTTRETSPLWDCLYFTEAHSHATEQKLVVNLLEEKIKTCKTIVFVEDEVTTGNTILQIINAINTRWPSINFNFCVASIFNGMGKKIIDEFEAKGIRIVYMHTLNNENYAAMLQDYSYNSTPVPPVNTLPEIKPTVILRNNADPRLGVNMGDYINCCNELSDAILNQLPKFNKGENILVLGCEEFMFAPLYFANKLEKAYPNCTIKFHATTRSPILPSSDCGYAIFSRFELKSMYDNNRTTYIYNLKKYDRVIVIHDSQQDDSVGIKTLQAALYENNCTDIQVFNWRNIMQSSYKNDDVIPLLKDITGIITPLPTAEREKCIQAGAHYSTMLPLEYRPSKKYLDTYINALKNYAKPTAIAVSRLAQQLVNKKGKNIVLVSLARAGIPIGILLKHYIYNKYGINLPHYTISIIRGRGIDKNAIDYLLQNHTPQSIQFVDGWIGKGAICHELEKAVQPYKGLSPTLAVLSDPANITDLCGTHEDLLIPSSCLNSTVSGLLSRTFLKEDIIAKNEFHGACCYSELQNEDFSYDFINCIESHFDYSLLPPLPSKGQLGMLEAEEIASHFGITNINLIKPGIGEATRVLLRRVPWKLLIYEGADNDPNILHLLQLAKEKNVDVEIYPLKNYKACGIIRNLADA